MEVSQSDAFRMESIEMRRLQEGIPVRGYVPVTLVIGDDQDNIGSLFGRSAARE